MTAKPKSAKPKILAKVLATPTSGPVAQQAAAPKEDGVSQGTKVADGAEVKTPTQRSAVSGAQVVVTGLRREARLLQKRTEKLTTLGQQFLVLRERAAPQRPQITFEVVDELLLSLARETTSKPQLEDAPKKKAKKGKKIEKLEKRDRRLKPKPSGLMDRSPLSHDLDRELRNLALDTKRLIDESLAALNRLIAARLNLTVGGKDFPGKMDLRSDLVARPSAVLKGASTEDIALARLLVETIDQQLYQTASQTFTQNRAASAIRETVYRLLDGRTGEREGAW